MSDIIAIGSSDWHLHFWSQFNKDDARVEVSKQFLVNLFVEAEELEVPILFPGDLFHTKEGISTKTFFIFSQFFNQLRKQFPTVRVIGIPGNHDQVEHSRIRKPSPNLFTAWCNCFPEIFSDCSFKFIETPNLIVSGIPYISHNIGFNKYITKALSEKIDGHKGKHIRVLLIHSDLPAAIDPSGREVAQVENIPRSLGKFFKDWDFVLAGHIHKPQVHLISNVDQIRVVIWVIGNYIGIKHINLLNMMLQVSGITVKKMGMKIHLIFGYLYLRR